LPIDKVLFTNDNCFMKITYKNNRLERVLISIKAVTSAIVVATFVILFGFYEPLLPIRVLFTIQIGMLFIFLAGKIIRFHNAQSKKEYVISNWFEIPMLIALVVAILGSRRWFGDIEPCKVRHFAVGIYLIIEVIIKICITSVGLAATGKNPTRALIASFLILIVAGAGLLMLPRASTKQRAGFIDALFTATSATCVTGLIVRDTGQDFSLMGQIIILVLIQLGGLGIVIFGVVFALLLGQALGLRGSVAMQDLLSARTLSQIGNMILFIFAGTILIETVGTLSLLRMWDNAPGWAGSIHHQWFCSIFHSISAFCNAGFSLFNSSLINYNRCWPVYLVVCPLIILGGLGFSVLYNLANIIADRVKLFLRKLFGRQSIMSMEAPKRMQLQTKIVLSVSALLIILGMLFILLFERYAGQSDSASSFLLSSADASSSGGQESREIGILGALFQSITARTAGFNTINIKVLTPSSKFILILLMFIGGSPGSTAGGIKTVTFAVIAMTVIAALRKRQDVEMFRRSVRIVVVGRAITIMLLFVVVLFCAALALSITENHNQNGFTMLDIIFETSSALGTVGLTTGITPFLTDVGKLIIIAVMLIGRLGPLTLLAAVTFNLKTARYNYPEEAIIVG
jgi:trk system potassium uptake protein TrkH